MTPKTPADPKSSAYFSKWYEGNKDDFAAKRKARYQSDPEYRAKAVEAARAYRASRRDDSPRQPEGYDYSFADAADEVGVSIWSMREWRKKDYFPEPLSHKGSFWFTAAQVAHLCQLRDFFETRGVRISAAKRADLDQLISVIYSNW